MMLAALSLLLPLSAPGADTLTAAAEPVQITEWQVPWADSRPRDPYLDGQDRLWFVESGPSPNQLMGFDPRSGEFFGSTPIASGGGTVRHMIFHAPSRELWFGTDANTIARARVP